VPGGFRRGAAFRSGRVPLMPAALWPAALWPAALWPAALWLVLAHAMLTRTVPLRRAGA